jgi:hypothetical protein
MALSMYVKHWSTDTMMPKIAMAEKMQAIHRLDEIAYSKIGQALKNIKNDDDYYYERQPRNYHQKFLQVQGNLFAFMQMLRKNENIYFVDLIEKLPLAGDSKKVSISGRQAQSRMTDGTSHTEQSVNAALAKNLPEIFKSKKVVPTACFIDPETGLELDYPLNGKIYI